MTPTLANGTLLGYSSSDSGFTTVPLVIKIGTPTVKTDYLDVTTHDDANYYEQLLAGISRGQPLRINGLFRAINAIHLDLVAANTGGTLVWFQIAFPGQDSAASVVFQAFVDAFETSEDVGQPVKFDMTLKPVGEPVWTS